MPHLLVIFINRQNVVSGYAWQLIEEAHAHGGGNRLKISFFQSRLEPVRKNIDLFFRDIYVQVISQLTKCRSIGKLRYRVTNSRKPFKFQRRGKQLAKNKLRRAAFTCKTRNVRATNEDSIPCSPKKIVIRTPHLKRCRTNQIG